MTYTPIILSSQGSDLVDGLIELAICRLRCRLSFTTVFRREPELVPAIQVHVEAVVQGVRSVAELRPKARKAFALQLLPFPPRAHAVALPAVVLRELRRR